MAEIKDDFDSAIIEAMKTTNGPATADYIHMLTAEQGHSYTRYEVTNALQTLFGKNRIKSVEPKETFVHNRHYHL